MVDQKAIEKPLIEQIYDDLIAKLEIDNDFDVELILRLKELFLSGDPKELNKLRSILSTKAG